MAHTLMTPLEKREAAEIISHYEKYPETLATLLQADAFFKLFTFLENSYIYLNETMRYERHRRFISTHRELYLSANDTYEQKIPERKSQMTLYVDALRSFITQEHRIELSDHILLMSYVNHTGDGRNVLLSNFAHYDDNSLKIDAYQILNTSSMEKMQSILISPITRKEIITSDILYTFLDTHSEVSRIYVLSSTAGYIMFRKTDSDCIRTNRVNILDGGLSQLYFYYSDISSFILGG